MEGSAHHGVGKVATHERDRGVAESQHAPALQLVASQERQAAEDQGSATGDEEVAGATSGVERAHAARGRAPGLAGEGGAAAGAADGEVPAGARESAREGDVASDDD